MHQLTTYQSEIARAVLDSVLNERGLTFTVEIARGGGVRELSAQIEHLLLTLHLNDGANLLRIAPPAQPTPVNEWSRPSRKAHQKDSGLQSASPYGWGAQPSGS